MDTAIKQNAMKLTTKIFTTFSIFIVIILKFFSETPRFRFGVSSTLVNFDVYFRFYIRITSRMIRGRAVAVAVTHYKYT